ncbi:8-amino-7-oxononanoate synthase [cf. Phormidesmis sp. LEGE 11477]|uniref:8-amino-7-oxononanoate synthase n=1 Tax=cf. Phormidesmis sp. LEGE 11477 TaxID=1828680 RepID=UPI0018803C74|nr:8-amino-7-oxononanoate synthase [cf. Phormidesmis sp. LEGE 11477]MBE9063390.1 8-amino-7-oxononanoate synthase [cf. Phormidesmis sp. LEGE 11477]
MTNAYRWIGKSLRTLHQAHWYRSVQPIERYDGPTVTIDGSLLVNLASNDYLGLATDPRLIAQVKAAVETYGTGATGSRLLSGHRPLHRALEQAIAQLKGTEDAIVFSSGYLANLGATTALVNSRDLILSDEYNHSSLKNGAILSGAQIINYAHSNLADLETKLSEVRSRYRRCLILTDGVFGMDGDICSLPEILDLGDQFEAMVMIDEAHSAGVLGKTGAGCAEHFGCQHRPMVQMGTLSKAFASLGGYVAGSAELIDFLRNRASSWIYTTGLSPADTAAALGAISLLIKEPNRLSQLRQNAQYLTEQIDRLLSSQADLLQADLLNLKRLHSDTAIVCLQVKDAATVVSMGQYLKQRGIFAAAIRPPTVPVSRLRLSLMATHAPDHIDRFIYVLADWLKSV